jgi:hypothetical protein
VCSNHTGVAKYSFFGGFPWLEACVEVVVIVFAPPLLAVYLFVSFAS